MGTLFGTDGIRASFGEPPLDRNTVTALGVHLARRLAGRRGASPLLLLGGDTRDSTPQLAAWLAAGLTTGGANVRYAGVLPTPGVARLVPVLRAAAGVAISASHNLWPDNGIKLLAADGGKWRIDEEARLQADLAGGAPPAPVGELPAEPALAERYLDCLLELFPRPGFLAGLRVTLDSANGAASGLAARLFERVGAVVQALGDRPDGRNINRGCGSTAPAAVARETVATESDLGIAFDGDADRAILVDEHGDVRDGDAILYLWARALQERGELDPPRIVATSMSNLGLERALARRGIGVERCEVGDRAVVETLRREGLTLGGEQSGHIVHLGLGPTGDGLVTALSVSGILRDAGRGLSELLSDFRRYPQVLRNVPVRAKPALDSLPAVRAAAAAIRSRLGQDGRLVLRYSGTEPVARVMLEGPDQATIDVLASELAAAIAVAIGSPS